MSLPAKAHVRQLLVDSDEKGREALGRLVAGEDFLEVSRQLSRAPNAAEGGELGFFDQGSLPPEIDEVIFSLAPGEFSDPVQGPSGYHVFQVLEVIPPGPPDIAAVEAVVRSEFTQTKLREHTQQCSRRLASEVGIEIYGNRLWFPYVGRYVEEMTDA
jgi:peptidyl-prolyl cis-trans isomerase C